MPQNFRMFCVLVDHDDTKVMSTQREREKVKVRIHGRLDRHRLHLSEISLEDLDIVILVYKAHANVRMGDLDVGFLEGLGGRHGS